MTNDEILSRLTELVRERFDYEGTVTTGTTASDVEGWDSVAHVEFIIGIESEFGIRLTTGETSNLPDVGALVTAIGRHLRK